MSSYGGRTGGAKRARSGASAYTLLKARAAAAGRSVDEQAKYESEQRIRRALAKRAPYVHIALSERTPEVMRSRKEALVGLSPKERRTVIQREVARRQTGTEAIHETQARYRQTHTEQRRAGKARFDASPAGRASADRHNANKRAARAAARGQAPPGAAPPTGPTSRAPNAPHPPSGGEPLFGPNAQRGDEPDYRSPRTPAENQELIRRMRAEEDARAAEKQRAYEEGATRAARTRRERGAPSHRFGFEPFTPSE